MEKINRGYTNKEKYKDDSKMIVVKTHNGFNHKLNYNNISVFDFAPNVLENNKEQVVTDFVEGESLVKPTEDDLIQLATSMRKIHVSDVELPKNNLKQRVASYLKAIHDKGIHIDIIEDNYKNMLRLIAKMQRINPVHNDIWMDNLIKDKNGKIWFVDWEYATMGDKHFDLAYYIEAQDLNDVQTHIFLEAYDAVDGESSYNRVLLKSYRNFILWFTICWAYAQDTMPFPVNGLMDKLEENLS